MKKLEDKQNETKQRNQGIFHATGILLVSMAFMPVVSAESQKVSWQRVVLEKSGFTVNNLEQTITSTEKSADKVVYTGTYKIDVEKTIDGQLKRLNTAGTFTTSIDADGSMRMECYSDTPTSGIKGDGADLSFVSDIKKIGEVNGKRQYLVNQQITVNGKTHDTQNTLEVPVNTQTDVSSKLIDAEKGMQAKTLYDLPSNAPWGSILLYNDVQASQIIAGGLILAAVAAAFGGTPGAVIGILMVAIDQVPALVGVAKEDIYVDIWFITWLAPLFPNNMYMEVDYYYN
jgi:hypothetical protein